MAGSRRDANPHQLEIDAAASACVPVATSADHLISQLSAVLPEMRDIEGCPTAEDVAILALSVPPDYTSCPNPFLADFLRREESASRGAPLVLPLAADISEGRSGPIYDAHSYHTKVPPEAIARFILHYTRPGDVVLDAFCGTGMTGVAAQLCADPPAVFRQAVERGGTPIEWGSRRAILADLSPYATFIAANVNLPLDVAIFERAAREMLSEAQRQVGWVYETCHSDGRSGEIQYTIWSEVFECPHCSGRFDFWSVAVDLSNGGVLDEFPCSSCGVRLSKREAKRVVEAAWDPILRAPIRRIVRRPVLLNYAVGGLRVERAPNPHDLELLARIEREPVPASAPSYKMMFKDGPWGDMHRAGYHTGVTHVHHFYTPRNYLVLATLWQLAAQAPPELSLALKFLVSSYNLAHATLMTRIIFKRGNPRPVLTGYQTGALYIGSLPVEKNVIAGLRNTKLPHLLKAFRGRRAVAGSVAISTQSATDLRLPESSVDYVFVDPPFGDNIKYSETSFIAEAWLRCFTTTDREAIISAAQRKGFNEYRDLMERSFRQMYAALRPGRWMTVEFHNSQNRVWNAIQEAILRAGFVVADVRTLDKQQRSFKQVTAAGAVQQDLVISAYKPNGGLERSFELKAGSPDGVWEFVRHHLGHLPIFVEADGKADVIAERQPFLLFDRMVAFHIQRGAAVPMSAGEFYAGLAHRFPERDGMYFLPDQIAEYDRRRLQVSGVAQMTLFVDDERSAIQWLRQELEKEPQTYQAIQPMFLRELHKARHEELPELQEILHQNFLEDYENRWYVPDPNKQVDLEKVREKALLREFEEYKLVKQKRLKTFRTEAVRAGFKAAWSAREYQTIVSVAQKLPDDVLQEDLTILQYYDNAAMRIGA